MIQVEWIHWSESPGRLTPDGIKIAGCVRYADNLPYISLVGGLSVTISSADGRLKVLTEDSDTPPPSWLRGDMKQIVNGDGWDDDGW